jgi:hypothetical protein
MARIKKKTGNPRKYQITTKTGWVVRSSRDGGIISRSPTKEEAVGRARFLANASLSAIPKKSHLTKAQAKKVVTKFLESQSRQTVDY